MSSSSQFLLSFCSTFVRLLFNFFPVPSRLRQLLRLKQIIYLSAAHAPIHTNKQTTSETTLFVPTHIYPSPTLSKQTLGHNNICREQMPSFSQFLINFWSSSSCYPSPTLSKQTLGHNKICREQMPSFYQFLINFWSSSSCHPSPTLSKQTLGHNNGVFCNFLSAFYQVLFASTVPQVPHLFAFCSCLCRTKNWKNNIGHPRLPKLTSAGNGRLWRAVRGINTQPNLYLIADMKSASSHFIEFVIII